MAYEYVSNLGVSKQRHDEMIKVVSKEWLEDYYKNHSTTELLTELPKVFNLKYLNNKRYVHYLLMIFNIDRHTREENCLFTFSHKYGDGISNPWQINEIRERGFTEEKIKQKAESIKRTCQEKYGVDNVFAADWCKDKIKKTMNSKYGIDYYVQSPNCRNLAFTKESNEKRLKSCIETCREKYGVDYWWQSDDYKERFRSPEQVKAYKEKEVETKKKNGTSKFSKAEEILYAELCKEFGPDDIIRQYKESRYPWFCDFYVISTDTFIELNGTWTHGDHPYDRNDEDDRKILEKLNEKSVELQSDYYKSAIEVWTVADPLKLKTALDNNLKYITIYKDCTKEYNI